MFFGKPSGIDAKRADKGIRQKVNDPDTTGSSPGCEICAAAPTPVEWDGYIDTHPLATGYHRHAWCDVINRSFGHETIRLAVRNRSGGLAGVLPLVHMKSTLFGNFLVSIPFLNYGGILCDSDEACRVLLDAVERSRRDLGSSHVELRHRANMIEGLVTKTQKVTMILDLDPDENKQWKKLDAKVRNQVRKAEKSGLKAISGHIELLDGFYEVFCRNMRDLGTPVYGKEFFRNVLSAFPDSTRIISIMLDGRQSQPASSRGSGIHWKYPGRLPSGITGRCAPTTSFTGRRSGSLSATAHGSSISVAPPLTKGRTASRNSGGPIRFSFTGSTSSGRV
jgi:hypothetical protein